MGVSFDRELCVADVWSKMAAPTIHGKLNRAPMVDMTIDGQLIVKGAALPMKLRNNPKMAQRFARHTSRLSMECRCASAEWRRKAIVRRTQCDVAGLVSMTPIPFAQLEEWVISIKMPAIKSTQGDSAVA